MAQPEQQPRVELDHALVAAYTATFIPRFDRYPKQLKDGTYVTVKRQLTMDAVAAHLIGSITLGAYGLNEKSHATWICFDADNDAHWDALLDLAFDLQRERVEAYIEPSRRGGHLWLFFDPIPGVDARRFGKQLIAGRHLEQVELYPRQDQLASGPGSLVRLPLGVHRLTNRRYHFITLEGEPLAPTVREQIALLAHPQKVPSFFITETLKYAPEPITINPTPPFSAQLTTPSCEKPSERIKSRMSVYEFVSQYVELDSQGRGYCPFHDDEHKSFSINKQGNYWQCFAGCKGATVIDFWSCWREKHGQSSDFTDTITELAQMLL